MNAATNPTTVLAALTELQLELVTSIGRHRFLTTTQLHALHRPNGADRVTRRTLGRIRDAGWIDAWRRNRYSPTRWSLTATGHKTLAAGGVDGLGDHRPGIAHGALGEHTWLVNEIGTTLTTTCRRLVANAANNPDTGALAAGTWSWTHEPLYRYGANHTLRPDALFTWHRTPTATGGPTPARIHIEADRGTEPVATVIAKLENYAALHTTRPPQWRRVPAVLIVTTTTHNGPRHRQLCDWAAAAHAATDINAATATITTLDQLHTLNPDQIR